MHDVLLDAYLNEFKLIADTWFDERNPFLEFNLKIRDFFKRENLEKAEWPDFQKLGGWLHSFNSVPLARSNAFGKPNYTIKKYRDSFIFLAYGAGSVEQRIRAFMGDTTKYASKYLGKGAVSELVGHLFGDDFMFMNNRDIDALKLLGANINYKRGSDFAAKFVEFNRAVIPIKDRYIKTVGIKTKAPIFIEVDQFLSWLYETKSEKETTASDSKRRLNPRPKDGALIGHPKGVRRCEPS